MAEGFEPYHVPQQSRRDKLRVINNQQGCIDNLQNCAALAPFYDPSLISSDFINLHRHSYGAAGVKEEGMNLMGFVNGNHNMYVDPQLSVQLNPSSIQDINGGNPYCYRLLDQSFHGNEAVVYKPEALSLSLSSHHNTNNNLPLELNLPNMNVFGDDKVSSGGYNNVVVACGKDNNSSGFTSIDQLCKSSSAVPLGPFTGYASVLKGSRFLKPAQQLLEELCVVRIRGIYSDKNGADNSSSALFDPPPLESSSENGINVDGSLNCGDDGSEQTRKKSRLLSMLDEVYKRYKQYYQQMQGAVAAFESVAGLSTAAPFANLALKALSKHFRCLKKAITDQLQFTSKSHGKTSYNDRDDSQQRLENSGRGNYSQRPFHVDQPVWRPQRGLPEHAVTVLRAWLFEHFLHPYPTDTDKLMLAKQTGLSRNQVSNWFINARVRLWKPMVEEIHMLETHQTQKTSRREEQPLPPSNTTLNDHHLPTISCAIDQCENASTSIQRINDEFPLKRNREDHHPLMESTHNRGNEVGPMRSSFENLLHNNPHNLRVGGGNNNGGVSLTLGLHQNGVGLNDSYPIHAARRFGLDSHGEAGFVVSGFAAQNLQFGRDVMDGQIMHDFVG